QPDVVDRLHEILRTLIAVASGRRRHRSVRGRRSAHGFTASHGRSFERREPAARSPWLVRRQISAWRLASIGGAVLVILWIGWRIVAQTAALSLAASHPELALDFVSDQYVALNRLAQKELVEPNGNLDSAREWAQRALHASPLNARALTLLGLIAEQRGDQKS